MAGWLKARLSLYEPLTGGKAVVGGRRLCIFETHLASRHHLMRPDYSSRPLSFELRDKRLANLSTCCCSSTHSQASASLLKVFTIQGASPGLVISTSHASPCFRGMMR